MQLILNLIDVYFFSLGKVIIPTDDLHGQPSVNQSVQPVKREILLPIKEGETIGNTIPNITFPHLGSDCLKTVLKQLFCYSDLTIDSDEDDVFSRPGKNTSNSGAKEQGVAMLSFIQHDDSNNSHHLTESPTAAAEISDGQYSPETTPLKNHIH